MAPGASLQRSIQEAEAVASKASLKELERDLDGAFQLYIKAAKSFLHLASLAPDRLSQERCKAAATRALERAEKIKAVKGNSLKPIAKDRFSQEEQSFVLEKSSRINTLRFPIWSSDTSSRTSDVSTLYMDPDGDLDLAQAQLDDLSGWKRPAEVLTTVRMLSPDLLPFDIIQRSVTNCSVIAALSVCLDHHRKFHSKLALSSLHPQDSDGMPQLSPSGKYAVRILFNGTYRQIIIDDRLPVCANGSLICASSRDNDTLWPSLIEKAYMKLMGGYDFPGSNSSIDIHALTGWIPDHIHMHSSDFQREKIWRRVCDGFSRGDCLVTVGTGKSAPGQLIPLHNYAITDIREVGDRRLIRVIDPWLRTSDSKTLPASNDITALQEGLEELALGIKDGVMDLEWDDLCEVFDGLYLNWNPKAFAHQRVFHGTWKAPKDDKITTEHFKLSNPKARPGTSGLEGELWCLISRHVVDKRDSVDYLALHAFEEEYSVSRRDAPARVDLENIPRRGFYSNSPHVLMRFKPESPDNFVTVVASRHGGRDDLAYTLTVLSPIEIELQDLPQQHPYVRTVEGSFTQRTSGGNPTYPTFMHNPQYTIRLKPAATRAAGSRARQPRVQFTAEGNTELPLHLKLVWSSGRRVTDIIDGDVIADSGAYSYGVARGFGTIQGSGQYTIIVSSFEPGQLGPFTLTVGCEEAFDIEPIPMEGAGMYSKAFKGAWEGTSAAGCPSLGQFHMNPIYQISLARTTQIQIRLQLANRHPSVSINVTLFSKNEGGNLSTPSSLLGRQLLTSGPYSDMVSGVITSLGVLSSGEYLIVPSTFDTGVEAPFVLTVYSTGVAVVGNRIP